MLSLLHHPNLVSLIDYCADGDQSLLVYEYLPFGSLEDHLLDLLPDKEPLDWNTRMKIAAGAARGLKYLHDKANPPVIYRDFKSSNILLDEEFHPKLSSSWIGTLFMAIGPESMKARELDLALTQLATVLPVDIMPGLHDPTNFSLPQQPLHKCLFSEALAYNTFVSVTNSHQFNLDRVCFLGISGQNIDNLGKYSDAKGKLDYMERTMNWRHSTPTSLDTLGCYPFTDRNLFVIEDCPHVYFYGNQKNMHPVYLKALRVRW